MALSGITSLPDLQYREDGRENRLVGPLERFVPGLGAAEIAHHRPGDTGPALDEHELEQTRVFRDTRRPRVYR